MACFFQALHDGGSKQTGFGSSFFSLHPGGEVRLSYTKSKLKAVGISLPQFHSVLEYFWHL